jgi:hypothetical protein
VICNKKFGLGDKIKKDDRTAHVAHVGERSNTRRIFVRKPEGNGPSGNCNCRRWIILKWILKK